MPQPLSEQVVVITGASSGVGRETALELARTGSSLVVAARNEEALGTLAQEVQRLGGTCEVVPTDVSQWVQVEKLAAQAVERFGRIDTWINAAATALYGRVADLSAEEMARTIEVILLGQVYGMKAALTHMQPRDSGVIVNVASALAVASVPLQAPYCAAKHGIRGFAESLRMELAHDHSGVQVCTVMPSSINTPLFDHARSHLGVKPMPVPPIYEPRVVARAILHVMLEPRAEVVVGGGGKAMVLLHRLSPQLGARLLVGPGKAFAKQQTSQPDDGVDNLFEASRGPGETTGQFGSKAKSTSLSTRLFDEHAGAARLVGVALGALVVLKVRRR